jgi:hypothetical protein
MGRNIVKKQDIINAIETRVKNSKTADYSIWRIGITHDPDERKSQHEAKGKSTKFWQQCHLCMIVFT